MSVHHGVDGGGTSPPEFGVGWTLMQIVLPLIFCHISTKWSVLWLSKYVIIRFRFFANLEATVEVG